MTRSYLSSLLTVSLFNFCHAQTLPDSIVAQLKAGVAGFQERYHSPSIVVAVVHGKDIVFSEASGYTDIEKRIPASIHSKYPVLSVTKTFTATMYMQLAERKIVKQDEDVSKYLPEYASGADIRRISLFQLATHSSGLPRNSPADISFTKQIDRWLLAGAQYPTIEPASKVAFLQSLKHVEKEYPDYQLLSYSDRNYSNLGYSMLGIALERAAKTGYTKFVMQEICKPLQMNHTGFDDEKVEDGMLAKGYYYNDSTKEFIPTPVFKSNSALYAGGMYSTAADLAKYTSFHFDESKDADKILSRENRAMMYYLKIGWKPFYPFVLHEGAMLGYRCQVAFNPDLKLGWVILTNTTDFEFSKINEYFSRLLVPVFAKKNDPDLNRFTGAYFLKGGYDSLSIYMKDGLLYSTYLQNDVGNLPLTPTNANRFKGQQKGNYSIGYDFILDEQGHVKFLNMGQLMWVKKIYP